VKRYGQQILQLLFALAGGVAFAGDNSSPPSSKDGAIKGVLAQSIGDAVCFSGSFRRLRVNVWDYTKTKTVPVPGLFRFGQQVTRPEPFVHVNQKLTRMTLLLLHDERELSKEGITDYFDEMHDFRLRISLKGWPKPLHAEGECALLLKDKPAGNSSQVWQATGSTLHCGIDCYGGFMSIERVAGTRDLIFRFDSASGGLRMSSRCSVGAYHVRGEAKPYREDHRKAEKRPAAFRLTPMPQANCAAFRKETDRGD
jgi:hypothetical protein